MRCRRRGERDGDKAEYCAVVAKRVLRDGLRCCLAWLGACLRAREGGGMRCLFGVYEVVHVVSSQGVFVRVRVRVRALNGGPE